MTKRRIKNYEKYAETAYISLNANRERWLDNINSIHPCLDTKRSIERIFYDQIISSGLDKTGLSVLPTKEYYHEKNNPTGVKPTDDHFNCPQGLTPLVDKLGIPRKDRYKHLNLKLYIDGNPNHVLSTSELEVEKIITDWETNNQIQSSDIKLKSSLINFMAA